MGYAAPNETERRLLGARRGPRGPHPVGALSHGRRRTSHAGSRRRGGRARHVRRAPRARQPAAQCGCSPFALGPICPARLLARRSTSRPLHRDDTAHSRRTWLPWSGLPAGRRDRCRGRSGVRRDRLEGRGDERGFAMFTESPISAFARSFTRSVTTQRIIGWPGCPERSRGAARACSRGSLPGPPQPGMGGRQARATGAPWARWRGKNGAGGRVQL